MKNIQAQLILLKFVGKKFAAYIVSISFIILSTRCYSQQLPIKPTRTVSFTTDEGSYMNVDISPDGRTIVFDLLGDLYTIPSKGGVATQITRGIALNLRPVWSPDSKKIAYVSDYSGSFHLNVIDVTGTNHLVIGRHDRDVDELDPTTPVWTPDGNIVFDGNIYQIRGLKISESEKPKNIINFSSDRSRVYFLDSGKLFIHELKTNTIKPVSDSLPNGYSKNGIISPDGRWWCYTVDSSDIKSLVLENLVNKKKQVLVPSLIVKDIRYSPWVPAQHFSFSPDSKNIFIGYGGKIHRIDVATGADGIIPFIAKVKVDLGPLNYHTFRVTHDPIKVRYTRSASVSSDGAHLAFSALGKIYIMDFPNGKPHVRSPQPFSQFEPSFSPDGHWIAYVSWSDTAGGYLWRIPTAGGAPERLTNVAGQYQQPTWSPDAQNLAVIVGRPRLGERDYAGIGRLQIISVRGAPPFSLDDSINESTNLTFSSDGRRVIYTPMDKRISYNGHLELKNTPELVSKNLDGTDLRVEAIGAAFTFYAQKILSPDNKFIVYSLNEDLYLVPNRKQEFPMVISSDDGQQRAIKFASGVDPHWELNGRTIAWTYGNRFFRVTPDKIMSAAKKLTAPDNSNSTAEKGFITVPVVPDETISLNISAPSQFGHGVLVLRDARILTMQKTKVIEHGAIIIKDGRIVAVGPDNTIAAPIDAKIIWLSGKTIIPGLIDMHLHMAVPRDIFPQQYWAYLINLAYGVTTARDPSLNFDSFGYAEMLQTGQMIGPRLITVGRAVRLPDGVVRFDNLTDARSVVKKRAELGGTVVKNYLGLPRIHRQWLLLACREAGLNMTNEGFFQPVLQLGMIKDGSTGVEHNPHWGDVYNDVILFRALSGTYFTPTLQVASGTQDGKEYFKSKYWRQPDEKLIRFSYRDSGNTMTSERYLGAESLESMENDITENASTEDTTNPTLLTPAIIDAKIRHAGGLVCMGSHGNNEGIGAHNEIWALQMGGFSNMEALQAATIVGAKGLGMQQDLGSIEVGKIADLVILNKNPLEDIHNTREILYVMKDGILYDGDTLDEVWPEKKKLPEWRMKSDGSANNLK